MNAHARRTLFTPFTLLASALAAHTAPPAHALPEVPVAALAAPAAAVESTEYVVLLERSADPAFRPAAERLARLHSAEVMIFDAGDLGALSSALTQRSPRHAALVMPPQLIDVEFAQSLIERLTALDDDPFLDVRYAFITGRDGAAAERFVEAIERARVRAPTGKALIFGSWEGAMLPPKSALSSLAALGLDGRSEFVKSSDPAEVRAKKTREVLDGADDADLLLLFSHGYPDRMDLCFSGRDLRAWKTRLPPSVVVSCACWNGCTGRWWMPGPRGFTEQPAPTIDESVALALLDSGIAGYVAGVDAWHGPLANQAAMHLLDGGLSLGDVTKAMVDRLALDFAPERIHLPSPAERTFTGEGREHRRRNAAAMIVFGDPAWAPFAKSAPRHLRANRDDGDTSTNLTRDHARDHAALQAPPPPRILIECAPLVKGTPADDFMLAQSRLLDYHSPRSQNVLAELMLEAVRVIDWPEPLPAAPTLRVVQASSAEASIRTGDPQAIVEHDGAVRRLHLRVPILIRAYGTAESFKPIIEGVKIEIEVLPPPPQPVQ